MKQYIELSQIGALSDVGKERLKQYVKNNTIYAVDRFPHFLYEGWILPALSLGEIVAFLSPHLKPDEIGLLLMDGKHFISPDDWVDALWSCAAGVLEDK